MKSLLISFIVASTLQACNSRSYDEKNKRIEDSLALVKENEKKEQAIKDSTVRIEQEKAIGEIKFGISEKEFGVEKEKFEAKCELPKMEFYKNATIFFHKLGDYGFNSLSGDFHHDSLYSIELRGGSIGYDDYERAMPEQYDALIALLKSKYGQPTKNNGFPSWTEIEKGYFRRCAVWMIGIKTIEVRISCDGINYSLNLAVLQPHVEQLILEEENIKKQKSTEKGSNLL